MNMIAMPLVAAVVTAIICLLVRRSPTTQRRVSILGGIVQLAVCIDLLVASMSGIQVLHVGNWTAPVGIALVVDPLSAALITLTALMGVSVLWFARHEVDDVDKRQGFHPLVHMLIFGVYGAFMTSDFFNLYVWFEVLLIASFALLVLGGGAKQTEAAVKYMALNLIGSMFFLFSLGLIYGAAGTLNMADLAVVIAQAREDGSAGIYDVASMLLVIAFGLKAGIFPLYFWLPASYHTPSVAVSALFAGLLTKVGLYSLTRTFTLVIPPGTGYAHDLLLVLGILTMILGVFGAAAQSEIRRILAVHIISQIGYLVVAVALATPLALAALVFYLIHIIIVKANLFLAGGLAARLGGGEYLYKMGGIARVSPMLAALFLISALSLAGLPPFSGFVAKLGVVMAAVEAQAYITVAAALGVGLLTLFSMLKIWYEGFWKDAPEGWEPHPPTPDFITHWGWRLAPIILVTVIILGLSVFAGPIFSYCELAAHQMLDQAGYIEAVLGPERAAEYSALNAAAQGGQP
ncbi:MAG: Na+/H+ antiporter subunit D [Planctomycetota bacterium]|nr:MAG: Na+/H+ antiporter subunit D [Planctomycetota bacterium]